MVIIIIVISIFLSVIFLLPTNIFFSSGPLIYFQRRPHGRILNKFSSDLMKSDLVLPDQAQSLLENITGLMAAFAFSMISVSILIISD
jgi:hypothetical protein